MRLYDTKYPKPIALDDNIAYREAIDYVKEKSKPGEKLYYDGRESIIVQVHPNGIVCTVLSGMFNTFLTWDELVRNGVLYFSAEVQNGVIYIFHLSENCSDRVLYCHATCEDYLGWCKKRNELKKLIFQEKMEISNYLEFRRSGVEKRNRKLYQGRDFYKRKDKR